MAKNDIQQQDLKNMQLVKSLTNKELAKKKNEYEQFKIIKSNHLDNTLLKKFYNSKSLTLNLTKYINKKLNSNNNDLITLQTINNLVNNKFIHVSKPQQFKSKILVKVTATTKFKALIADYLKYLKIKHLSHKSLILRNSNEDSKKNLKIVWNTALKINNNRNPLISIFHKIFGPTYRDMKVMRTCTTQEDERRCINNLEKLCVNNCNLDISKVASKCSNIDLEYKWSNNYKWIYNFANICNYVDSNLIKVSKPYIINNDYYIKIKATNNCRKLIRYLSKSPKEINYYNIQQAVDKLHLTSIPQKYLHKTFHA